MSTLAALRSSPRVLVGGALVGTLFAIALLAPWLAPHDPNAQDLIQVLLPPAWLPGGEAEYPFGTYPGGHCSW